MEVMLKEWKNDGRAQSMGDGRGVALRIIARITTNYYTILTVIILIIIRRGMRKRPAFLAA